jgi:phage shock protein A
MSEPESHEHPVIEGEVVDDVSTPADVPAPAFDYTDGGVPTFDYVRDRIEGRLATSVGSQELAAETPQGRTVEEQMAERDKAGRDKLEEIRRAMRGE